MWKYSKSELAFGAVSNDLPHTCTIGLTSIFTMSRPISRPGTTPLPRPTASVNTQTKLLDTVAGRILCVADIRGRISSLNELARDADAKAVIHTGDFGFFGEYALIDSSCRRFTTAIFRELELGQNQ